MNLQTKLSTRSAGIVLFAKCGQMPGMDIAGTNLTEIASVIAIAVSAGFLLTRLGQPALVGYILAGAALGPTGLGLVQRSESVSLLAEMGVLMLLFIVGMELSVRAFVRVLTPALLTVLGQVFASLALSFAVAHLLGWTWQTAVVFAFIVALSSTAVAMKILEDVGELRTLIGQITVGILIAQDLAVVPMLIIVESFEGGSVDVFSLVPRILVALVILSALLYWFSKHGKIAIPGASLIEKRPELLALLALALCFGTAAVSGTLGLSPAYGAFLAGLAIGNTTLRSAFIAVTGPIQSVLLVVFFLSIGLLIDLHFIIDNAMKVLAVTSGVILIKTLVNVLLLRLVGQPWDRASEAGLMTAQGGEFSFVIAAAALAGGAFDRSIYDLAMAVLALSLLFSPLWISIVKRIKAARQKSSDTQWLESIGARRKRAR
jgi:monovalent cation:H+ antiporter-2, CPA2 family